MNTQRNLMIKKLLPVLFVSLFLAGCAEVGNLVWLDNNGNGIQDAGEPGLAGVEVSLFNPTSGDLVAEATTDSAGFYRVSPGAGVTSGDYYLGFSSPTGYVFTLKDQGSDDALDSDVDPANGTTQAYSISGYLDQVDAGLMIAPDENPPVPPNTVIGEITAPIGDRVWQDLNANGIQDQGEPGMAEVSVTLLDADGNLVAATTTDAGGSYVFDEQAVAAEYFLSFQLPAGFIFTLRDQGSNEDVDSDADPINGETSVFTLTDGGVNWLDAGLVPVQPEALGPDDFPAGYNPLTGQPMCDPEAANGTVVGISISMFPPDQTRPATGLQWAAWVTESWIGQGDTRLYALFYGCYPELDVDSVLGEQQGEAPPEPEEGQYVISDLVWYDSNANSMQDAGEPGVPGVQVELVLNGEVIATDITDGAGRYAFIVDPLFGFSYIERFTLPPQLQLGFHFVNRYVGDDDVDSNPDPATGLTDSFMLPESGDTLDTIDAGIRYSIRIEGIRSGRIVFEVLRKYFEGCTVIAGADPTVLEQMVVCAQASNPDPSDIGGAGIDVTKLKQIALDNVGLFGPPNLTGNLFNEEPPADCQPANSLTMFYNINNQTYWLYDPEAESFIRHQNTYHDTEFQEISVEALTGLPLHFENVIVMFAPHEVLNADGTIIDVSMESTTGPAKLLRNGLVCDIRWSTINGDYEQETGRTRPIRFTYADGTPFPLKPGQLFIHMVHTNADFFEPTPSSGDWRARWYTPEFEE